MYDVCIVTTIHRDFDNRIYSRQANALIDAGLRVCIVAPWDFSNRSRTDFDYVQTAPVTRRAARIAHGFRTYCSARRVAARAYIFHDPDFLPFAWMLKKKTQRPVIYDCHENIPEDIRYGKDWVPRYLRPVASRLFSLLEDAIVNRLGWAIVVVPHQLRRFERLDARVQLVRNFSRLQVPNDIHLERAVLYTGDLTRDYGVCNLIGIAREMSRRKLGVPLRIVDRFYDDESARSQFRELIAREKLPIELLSSVLAEDMPRILVKGCIGLSPLPDLPNKRIAYPTKIFEYFAFGLVVIASDIAGTREILESGKLGILVRADDYVGWVDRIEKLLGDDGYFKRCAEEGKAAQKCKYNWEAESEALVAFVRRASCPAGV